ncbi:diiron oxygenase [Acidihalobacter ferrooxydans]|uniref:Aminobenzoate oxygenase n=1 Tax=Acidihalobacter ferrooxydans TaxID=1765967 RepID=A0A1P8UHM0_9GAMM|nr:diiron oxygenase [Acidihalobacter ferrooxydans]APZ43264.1 hypothetical protein BW247_09300 [Acidihalobacter ferrooxydans]
MGKDVTALIDKLNRSSTPYSDPLSRIDWASLDLRGWWLPQAATSLYGLPEFEALPETQRIRVSQHEFVNFIEKALWLEGIFMERISRALADSLGDPAATTYRLHELREEAGHSLMFLDLIRRSGLSFSPGAFKRPGLATLVGRHAPYDSAAFWIAVLIGEQIPDHMNRFIRQHREEISPAIYDVITTHAIDEARHIAHARKTLDSQMNTRWTLLMRLYPPLLNRIFRQFVQAFYFPTAELYELAGLNDGAYWQKAARRNQRHLAFVDQCVASTVRQLADYNIHLKWR